MTDAPRPKLHLTAAARLYPGAWRQADQFRSDRGKNGLPDWPDWCYLPMSAWYAIVAQDARVPVLGLSTGTLARVPDVGRLAALGTWRVTQGIYRFDPALLDAIWETPLDGDLPADLFYRLPQWGVYIETHGHQWAHSPLYGFFVHLEWDTNTARAELRLLLDSEAELLPLPIHIGPWPLNESVRRAVEEARRQSIMHGATVFTSALAAAPDLDLAPLISLILYLCSEAPDFGEQSPPANPIPKRTKQGWRLFAPDRVTIFEVGARLGAALRNASSREHPHASPSPHIRRAHWHTYLVGPGRTERVLRWLPPIPVGFLSGFCAKDLSLQGGEG